jgi:hypothetical protein
VHFGLPPPQAVLAVGLAHIRGRAMLGPSADPDNRYPDIASQSREALP